MTRKRKVSETVRCPPEKGMTMEVRELRKMVRNAISR
jgi:hypothetical protein